MHSVQSISKKLDTHRARDRFERRFLKRSSVLLLLRDQPNGTEVLMIKRSHREGDPWSGQMGFPGGRQEKHDLDDLATAVRETQEEIGLDTTTTAHCIGQLSDLRTHLSWRRAPKIVKPYVFHLLEPASDYLLNDEVAEVIWVPMGFLADHSNRGSMQWQLGLRKTLEMPCYHYRGRQIWGLSLRMLDELLAIVAS